MSEIDKDLSERYRAAARDEPPARVDAAILAAATRAVGAKPHPVGAARGVRRWYVPVSLAAVIMLSVIVTLRIERERPEIVLPDEMPVARQIEKAAQPAPEPPAAPPAAVAPRPAARTAPAKPAPAQPAPPAFVPDPKAARDAMSSEKPREDAPRSTDDTRGPAESGSGKLAESSAPAAESAGSRREARAMSAPTPAASQMTLARRELSAEAWLERIAELRKLRQDKEADEQLAEFKRRHPDYRIPEAMIERIAPRK